MFQSLSNPLFFWTSAILCSIIAGGQQPTSTSTLSFKLKSHRKYTTAFGQCTRFDDPPDADETACKPLITAISRFLWPGRKLVSRSRFAARIGADSLLSRALCSQRSLAGQRPCRGASSSMPRELQNPGSPSGIPTIIKPGAAMVKIPRTLLPRSIHLSAAFNLSKARLGV